MLESYSESLAADDTLLQYQVLPPLAWSSIFLLRPRCCPSRSYPGWAIGFDPICFIALPTLGMFGKVTGNTYFGSNSSCPGTATGMDSQCRRNNAVPWNLSWVAYLCALVTACVLSNHSCGWQIQVDIFVCSLLHLVLFGFACRALHLHRREQRRRRGFGEEMVLTDYERINESQERIFSSHLRPESRTFANLESRDTGGSMIEPTS